MLGGNCAATRGVTMDVGRRVLLMKSWVVMRVVGGEDDCVAEGDLQMVLWECIGNYRGSRRGNRGG